jgi:hypothetical protein
MLYEFRDRLVMEYKKWWFVWEEAWEAFRPVNAIEWDGQAFVFDDREYCLDPTDPLYGYGTQIMKDLCGMLSEIKLEEIPEEMDTLETNNMEWFFDRRVAVATCAPRDRKSWRRMVQNDARTCRKAPKGKKFTRRCI